MNFWQNIQQQLSLNRPLVLLYVLESAGSSPGRQGFKMFVSGNGYFEGSIGGGIMEHKLVELSKELLKEGRFSPFLKRQIHRTNIPQDKSGMICSGEQTVVFYYLDKIDLTWIDKILNTGNGVLQLDNSGITYHSGLTMNTRFHSFIEVDKNWMLKEHLGFQYLVYIIGGGHVGKALSQIMGLLGFYITVLDNREGLNTMEENHFAHEKKVVSYDTIQNHIPEGEHVYVVLMSFGYKTDEICLKQLLGKKFRYFGVMGSVEKMKTLLRIDSSIRKIDSISRAMGDHYVMRWKAHHPAGRIITRDLQVNPVPHLTHTTVQAFFRGHPTDDSLGGIRRDAACWLLVPNYPAVSHPASPWRRRSRR